MASTSLSALSPVDGRYAAKLDSLRALFSEAGLIEQRVRVEAAWLLHLADVARLAPLAGLPETVRARLTQLASAAPQGCAEAVKGIESRINHDVKAVEYFMREQLQSAGASTAVLEQVHFACTSEDINNISYARMMQSARTQVLLPAIDAVASALRSIAHQGAGVAMLARTHGQPASPTTLGKEIANFTARLDRQRTQFAALAILGKFNGATGNFNAHRAALPAIDWPTLSRRFVESLGLEANAYTTQIEPHDWIAEHCDALARIHTLLIGLCRDVWGYVSLGYFRQRVVAGEVGSSTMPHKINPIDFENAEGNFGVANALLRHFSEKLPISRWQRDLTDSTVLRNLGVALGHGVIGYQSLLKGLAKLEIDASRIARDLDGAWEVLTEALQTVMRAHGIANAYEQMKSLSRGQDVSRDALLKFIDGLAIPAAEKTRLKGLTPATYTGYAADLARLV